MSALVSLVRYDAACRALAEAKSVDEVKDIRDKAEAMKAYARQAKNKDLESDAWEIRTRAERRLGELIVFQKQTVGLNEGGRPSKTPTKSEEVSKPTLADAGIDHKLSSWAQQVATIPEESFEAAITEGREAVAEGREKATAALFGRVVGMPNFSGEDVSAHVSQPRDLIHAEPRSADSLKDPIVGYHDLLATMRGYRNAQGLSQLATDDLAGTQGGYVGKLELDIRRAVNESWWDWMHALRLVMLLVPAVDAVRADRCPCCRQAVKT